tara:strand:- start:2378 stop:3154 length:777 start_codon:yes stop_codon:yes gene_type:complete
MKMILGIDRNGLCKLKVPPSLIDKINYSIFQKYEANSFEDLSIKINNLNEKDFSKISKKINRFLSCEICFEIEKWIKESKQLRNILKYKKMRISNISPYESQENNQLNPDHLDIFFRLVRQYKKDIGPPHYDELIWKQSKNTNAEVSFNKKEERWKIWIPLKGVNKKNSLQFVRGSHLENVPWYMDTKRITQTSLASGKIGSPAIDVEWLSNNEKNFKPECWETGEAVLFHDKLVHRGPVNQSSKLRTSVEFTILILK